MWRLQQGVAGIRPHADALVAEGLLERVAVEGAGGGAHPGGSEPGDPAPPVLLSPFDNLLWTAPLVRAFGFRHVIEVYKRGPSGCTATTSSAAVGGPVRRTGGPEARPAGRTLRSRSSSEPGIRQSGALRAPWSEPSLRLARCIGAATVDSHL